MVKDVLFPVGGLLSLPKGREPLFLVKRTAGEGTDRSLYTIYTGQDNEEDGRFAARVLKDAAIVLIARPDTIAERWNASAVIRGLSLPAVLISGLRTEAEHGMCAHFAMTTTVVFEGSPLDSYFERFPRLEARVDEGSLLLYYQQQCNIIWNDPGHPRLWLTGYSNWSSTTTASSGSTVLRSIVAPIVSTRRAFLIGVSAKSFPTTHTRNIGSAVNKSCLVARKRKEECEAHRAWTVQYHGENVSLRDKADQVLVLFDRVKQIGDIIVNVDPLHAGILYAGVRLIFEAEGIPRVPLQPSADPATTNFEAAIVNFYAFVLEFLAKSISIYEKASVVRFVQAFAKIRQGSDFQTKCAEHERRTEAEAAICERFMSQMNRQQAKSFHEDLRATIGKIRAIRNVSGSIDRLHQKLDLLRLQPVAGAAFDSYAAEETAMCLANTRVDLLTSAMNWADDSNGSCIYWLKGMAGTGKSIIARTVADMLSKKQMIGASFFFKRREADRSSSRKLSPTLAYQIAARPPPLSEEVAKSLDSNLVVCHKVLRVQFDKLMLTR
ncbi:hypothetical protein EJ03DRAFT_351169 [Teratosphaeria nubilosa]|uniref:Nephrocystin 3-like N-terminal domain-containing protein n=1 Tax=Teratosphaeria nubilosa TaxID=161662 RepID=A0A6G1LBS6_9PEZI|nr:hypothetical protein EJ03DRAFT_351169 [Teratosphaeria nubilosa]